jgi:hypothetical protein
VSGVVRRGLAVWLLIVAVEIAHGIARTLLLQPRLSDLRARQVAVFTGSALILAVTTACVRWIGARRRNELLALGLLWLALMLAFELLFGRYVAGQSWERLASDYDLPRGGLLPIGMAVLALAPWLAARLRGCLPPA